jgi:signal transduction histidine kinase
MRRAPAAVTDVVIDPSPRSAASTPHAAYDPGAVDRRLRRLALDVHDGPMQSLVAVGFGLRDLRRQLDERPREKGAAVDQLDQMVAELVDAEQGLRSLITTLDGGGEETDSLEVIAARELERFSRRSSAATRFAVTADCHPDSHSQCIAIASVLREALANVAKHADARTIAVSLEADDEGIVLRIEDDGRGFDPAEVGSDRIGLQSMRDRLLLLGGELTISTRLGGPTVVTATLPRWNGTAAH